MLDDLVSAPERRRVLMTTSDRSGESACAAPELDGAAEASSYGRSRVPARLPNTQERSRRRYPIYAQLGVAVAALGGVGWLTVRGGTWWLLKVWGG